MPLAKNLATSAVPYITLISENKEGVHYIIKSQQLGDDAIMILGTSNDIYPTASAVNGYWLLLLFLVSALISLLIVHLIYQGIKRLLSSTQGKDVQVRLFYILYG